MKCYSYFTKRWRSCCCLRATFFKRASQDYRLRSCTKFFYWDYDQA